MKQENNGQPSSIVSQDPTAIPKDSLFNISISPFDSVPPPANCDDWDTKSDSLSDVEEYDRSRVDETYSRFSVFDNEPPSLGPNESSGIVRDYSTNR